MQIKINILIYQIQLIDIENNPNILHIFGIEANIGIVHEWIDIRGPFKWNDNENIIKLGNKIWSKSDGKKIELSVITLN